MAEFSYTTGTNTWPDGTPSITHIIASSSVFTTGNVTRSGSSGLMVASCNPDNNTCSAAGTGFTALNDTAACFWNGTNCSVTGNFNTLFGQMVEYKTGVGSGSQHATFAGTTGDDADSVVLSF